MIVGDFNIDLLKVEHKPTTKEYLDSIMTQGFPPKITFPTRFSDMNGTLIVIISSTLLYLFTNYES